jgi:hypothetical protein
VFLLLFGLFALPLLRRIEHAALRSVREQEAADEARYRAASLTPRRLSNYLAARARIVPGFTYVLALALLAARVSAAGSEVRLTLPLGFAAVAGVFLFLYEAWMSDEALGGSPADGLSPGEAEAARRQRVRQIFAVQVTLTAVFSALSLAAAGIPWQSPAGSALGASVAAAGAIVGTLGCAFAISSGVQDRELRHAIRRKQA